jgi:hypothetical protein
MKSIGLAVFAFAVTVAGAADAQTILARSIKSEPVETITIRQPDGKITTTRRITKDVSLKTTTRHTESKPRRVAAAPTKITPPQQIVYRTVVREPAPQLVVVREPHTTWVPSLLPPFMVPVTTMVERTQYVRPGYPVVDDEDAAPVVVRASSPTTVVIGPEESQVVASPTFTYDSMNGPVLLSDPDPRVLVSSTRY